MLIKEVVKQYGGKARYLDENYGDSPLAERFGVRQYPAVFVDDALVALPRDFFSWDGEGVGRYTPWKAPENRLRFKRDLSRMIDLRLKGQAIESRPLAEAAEIETLPRFTLEDISGNPLSDEDLRGRIAVVEFWATWCPPCIRTMKWLSRAESRWGGEVAVAALAVASEPEKVRSHAPKVSRMGLATPEILRAFGDVTAVPALFIFDPKGRVARILYGAPPDLHERVDALVRDLRKKGSP